MDEKKIKEFIQKIKSKEGGNHMGLTALERYWDRKFDEKMEQGLKQGLEKGMQQGMKEYKIEIILKMLKNNMDEETIR